MRDRPSDRDVDWARVAEPQLDGSDTDRILQLVAPRGHGPPDRCSAPSEPSSGSSTPLDGTMWFAVAPAYAARGDFRRDFRAFRDAPPTHPNLARAAQLVDRWPLGSRQARRLVDVVHPALDPTLADDLGWDRFAAASHSYDDAFGTLWTTVHSPLGVAEAIVHEMAHHKLRACGVRFESADAIVANPPGECHPSPILGGRRRPMPAVLHGFYAVLHVVALELAIVADGDASATALARRLLRRNLGLLAAGRATLRRHLVVDRVGAAFVPAALAWHDRLSVEAGQL